VIGSRARKVPAGPPVGFFSGRSKEFGLRPVKPSDHRWEKMPQE